MALPWLFFGHSNHVYTEDVPLSVRFTTRAAQLVCSKTMFLCSQIYAHPHAHYPRYRRFESKRQYIAIGTNPAANKLPIYERHQAHIRPQHMLPVELSEAMVFHFFNKVCTTSGSRDRRHVTFQFFQLEVELQVHVASVDASESPQPETRSCPPPRACTTGTYLRLVGLRVTP